MKKSYLKIVLLFLLSQNLYADKCPNNEYIKYETNNFKLSFIHKGFIPPQLINPKTKKAECDISLETYLYNKSTKPPQKIILYDGVTGIKEYGADLIAISTYAGAHSGMLYFFKKDKNGYLKEVEIQNETYPFCSNMGSSIYIFEHGEKETIYSTLEVEVHDLSDDRKAVVVRRYRLNKSRDKFLLIDKKRILKDK